MAQQGSFETSQVQVSGKTIFVRRYGSGPLGIWRQWAPRAHGQKMKGGHFFPGENPDDTVVLVRQFLSA
jgi:hypothetical protein